MLALVGTALALAGVAWWGHALIDEGTDLRLFAAPFFAEWDPSLGWGIAGPLALASVIVLVGPRIATTLRWGTLLGAAWATTAVWSVALSASTGVAGLTRSVRSRYDYAAVLPEVHGLGLGRFIRSYVALVPDAPVHVKSHPPGMVLVLWLLDVSGLRGSGWAASALIVVTATVPVALAVIIRRLAAEDRARAALPFLVCAPWTLLVATVADGLFAAVTVWTLVLTVIAATAMPSRRATAAAAGAGVLAAAALHLNYGLAPLLALTIPAIVAPARRWRLLLPMVGAAAVVTGCWLASGFAWWDGLAAARQAYRAGVASQRPFTYFVVANVVVFAVMLGPAALAALAHPGPAGLPRRLGWLVLAGVAAVALADLSGLSKGEVERIWAPFLVVVSIAVVPITRSRAAPWWLATSAATTIALESTLNWPW